MKPTPPLTVPLLAGVTAAVVGVGVWMLLYTLIQTPAYWLGGPLVGAMIGVAVRATNKAWDRRAQPIAAVLTLASCWIGYATVYTTLATFVDPSYQPTFGAGLRDFFNYLDILVLTALGCYIAYVLARSSPRATAPE